jgi:hypothetical protein
MEYHSLLGVIIADQDIHLHVRHMQVEALPMSCRPSIGVHDVAFGAVWSANTRCVLLHVTGNISTTIIHICSGGTNSSAAWLVC